VIVNAGRPLEAMLANVTLTRSKIEVNVVSNEVGKIANISENTSPILQ